MKEKQTCSLLIVAFALFAPCIVAEKLDCNKPNGSADRAQCADQDLTAAEAELKGVLVGTLLHYSEGKTTNTAPFPKNEDQEQHRYDARMRRSIRASQKAWLSYRATACNAVAEMYGLGTIAASAVPNCKAALTRERAKFLRDYFAEQ